MHPCGDKTGDRVENDIAIRNTFTSGFMKDHIDIDCGFEYAVFLQDCAFIGFPAKIKILLVMMLHVFSQARIYTNLVETVYRRVLNTSANGFAAQSLSLKHYTQQSVVL